MVNKAVRVKNEIDLAAITENAFEYAKLAYEQEEKREESLINQATQMTTYFSFVSVLILMVIPIIVYKGTIIPPKYTATVSVITLLLLFISMFLAVIGQWRFKYQSLASPLDMFEHIMSNTDYFKTQEQRNKSFVQSLNTTWTSKRKNNDKRARLIKASMIVFIVGVSFYIAGTVFAVIAYLV